MPAAVSKWNVWCRNERGAAAILFGIMIVPAIGIIGLGIDGYRALSAATLAQNAIDAAALATAKAMSEQDLHEDDLARLARDFVAANTAGAPSAAGTFSNLRLNADRTAGAVTLSIDAEIETSFTRILGRDHIRLSRTATAVHSASEIELAMVLDVTGSMSGRKIRDLKNAAGDLVDILLPDKGGAGRTRLALAPYAAAVNAGPYAGRVSDGASADGCLVERRGALAASDAAPGPGAWLSAYPDPDLPRNSRYSCLANAVEPLSDDGARLRRAIARLRAEGWTAGHLGTAWGWYLLSPEWAAVWPADSAPRPYGARHLIKAVVLMSDGEFNTSYANGPVNRTSDSQARALCRQMKDRDVVVFAVGFELREATAIATLEDCASGPSHLYLAENGAALRQAFRDIAVKLTNLRLAQ